MANPHGAGRLASMSYLALGIGLLTETSFALAQTPSATLVAQVTGTVTPSGVLMTPPPAPVPVPPSGVLPTVERRAVTALPFKTARKVQTTKIAAPLRTRRHIVHRSTNRREATRPTSTVNQSAAAMPLVVKTSPEQPSHGGIGYELFLSPLGKGKEAR
jgi:hypothetical protein